MSTTTQPTSPPEVCPKCQQPYKWIMGEGRLVRFECGTLFTEGCKLEVTEMCEVYERLAAAQNALARCVGVMEKNIYPKPDVGPDHPYSVLREAREALETPHAK